MTLGIPGRAAPGSALPRRTAPAARISLSALALNLRAVVASTQSALIDVRADAWGHGAGIVARSAVDAGAVALLVDAAGAAALQDRVDASLLTPSGVPTSPEAVYGLSDGFTPVFRLSGFVLSLKPLRAGEGVSYGYTHRAPRDTIVALVTGGYAQGVVRALGNAATVRIAGERHPIVGRVAMDVCVVDVGGAAVAPGDEVVFFGDPSRGEPSLHEWSAASGMVASELVTAVGLRNAREYVA
ncbi:MAG: alanine racemase C-terminal domain-containing protein [Microbacterium sp.]